MDGQKVFRGLLKAALRPFVRWRPLEDSRPGYSLVLGTPWALRHLLVVNLGFVARMNLEGLDRIHIVFDRTEQEGGEEFIAKIRARFPDLPLDLRFQPSAAGKIVAKIHRSKFYASLNWITGLGECRTKYAILHDFDLYPLDPDYFQKIHRAMVERGLRFSGAEHTHFDGLSEADRLIGTWCLGIDVEWMRRTHRPLECFHRVMDVSGRRVDLDAFSAIQHRTPERGLADGVGPDSYVHVRNLVSTYLLFSDGKPAHIAWRLHNLWYLESLAEPPRDLSVLVAAMDAAGGTTIEVDGTTVDFADVHHTCANVLERELVRMERALFGEMRPIVRRYLDSFAAFLARNRKDAVPAG